jgi:hypothetical protein
MKHQKLKFSLFPAGGIEVASSRIRVYEFQSALSRLGIETTFGYSLKSNVLFFQKKISRENLWQARLAKAMGKMVIYDVDDLGEALWYWIPRQYFHKILRIADIVTTCSKCQMNYLKSKYNIKHGYIIPNAIDYFPVRTIRMKEKMNDNLKIIWFGNSCNFPLMEKYLDTLSKIPSVNIFAVVGSEHLEGFQAKYPNVKFEPWSVCDFVSVLQSCDLACLMHDGKLEDVAKGNNRMITAISWGVPAVISRTPEYEKTAREAGIEFAIFSNESELIEVIERLRTVEARKKYLDTAQPIIWDRFCPDVIAQKYIDLALKHLYD